MSNGMQSKPIELAQAGAQLPCRQRVTAPQAFNLSKEASAHDIIGFERVFDYSKEKSRE
jgi:hypothetical protein